VAVAVDGSEQVQYHLQEQPLVVLLLVEMLLYLTQHSVVVLALKAHWVDRFMVVVAVDLVSKEVYVAFLVVLVGIQILFLVVLVVEAVQAGQV
jgi:presenilin-like A22 family membrane protease